MKSAHLIAALSILVLASCANKAQMGAGGGAAGGALIGQAIGHDTESTLIGAAVGGALGYMVGNEWDKFDQQQLSQAYERTPSGQSSTWVNPDSGNEYQVTPQPAYQAGGQTCRKAEVLATIDGRAEKTYTTACRDMDGNWQMQQ